MTSGNEMDELEKHIPDDFWRKAFDEAAETPPPRVWSAIEHRLDESKSTKILPLWIMGLGSSRPVAWGLGIAATAALLLVSWWLMNNSAAVRQNMAQLRPKNLAEHNLATHPGRVLSPTQSPASGHEPEANVAVVRPHPASAANRLANQGRLSASGNPVEQPFVASARPGNRQPAILTAKPSFRSRFDPTNPERLALQSAPYPSTVRYTMASVSTSTATGVNSYQPVSIENIALRPIQFRSPGQIQRIVWFRPDELPLEPEKTKNKHDVREMWASVSLMPGSFNPLVSVRSAQTATFTNAAAGSQPSVNSRASFSTAYQASAGIKLTNRWSVEGGIGYLVGRSTVVSPAELGLASPSLITVTMNQTVPAGNLFTNAVRNSLHNTKSANVSKANYDNLAVSNQIQGSYDVRNPQTVTNNYQYVQVPVQVGYHLRMRKRLSIAILGGLLTNIFVRNTVGDDLVVTGKDGVYRPLSWAATMGARIRYRPSRQWSASLAGVYQPALGVGTTTESLVQSHPTTAGMSFGVDYHF